jgi:type II secretion system protein N
MRKLAEIMSYVTFGFFTTVFFIYWMFPYEVLKETIAIELSEATGLNFNIGGLGPAIPLGVKITDLTVANADGESFTLKKVNAYLSARLLFIGRAGIDLELEDSKKGVLDFSMSFKLFDLLFRGQEAMPNSIYLDAKRFLFGKLVNFILAESSQSPTVNVMLKPILESIDIGGTVDALLKLNIDSSDLSSSAGEVYCKIADMRIKASGLPDQNFSKAVLKGKLEAGTLEIDKESGFVAEEFSLIPSGKLLQKPDIYKSVLDLQFAIGLGPTLTEQFGIIITALVQKETAGNMVVKVSGPMVQPSITYD